MNQVYFNWCFFPSLLPIKFFPTPPITEVRLQLCCGTVLHLSGVWLFLLSLMLPKFDRSPTLLVNWWCQLARDSTTSSQIFQDIFFLDFKNSSWIISKKVILKGISSLVTQSALQQSWGCEIDELVYLTCWLKQPPGFQTSFRLKHYVIQSSAGPYSKLRDMILKS